jgi:hypothetical protein
MAKFDIEAGALMDKFALGEKDGRHAAADDAVAEKGYTDSAIRHRFLFRVSEGNVRGAGG